MRSRIISIFGVMVTPAKTTPNPDNKKIGYHFLSLPTPAPSFFSRKLI